MSAELCEAVLTTLVQDTSAAIAATDSSGRMTLMSAAMEELLGRSFRPVPAGEMPRYFDLWTEDCSRRLRPHEVPVTRARQGECFRDVVVVVRRSDATPVFLRCSGGPLRASDGSVQGGVVQAVDITAERLLARRQGALRERLVDTINHELRTPVTKVLGHAELLGEARDVLPPAARRSVEAVLEAGADLQGLAQTVSELVDLDAAGRVEPACVDVVGLVRSVVARAERDARERGIRVATRVPEHLHGFLDPDRVRAALRALLANALTHSPRGALVEVRVGSDAETVWFDVCDTGPGIPAAERSRLLQPFERGEHPGQPVSARGLGLAVASAVAESHGGSLTLQDRAPRGLQARLCLRRTASTPARAAASRAG